MSLHRPTTALVVALLAAGAAHAGPFVLGKAGYSNDRTTSHGKTDSCIVGAVVPLDVPSEQLDFQLLAFPGLIGWRAAVSRRGSGPKASSIGTVSDVRFQEADGVGPPNVRSANTPDGHLMAYLVDMQYAKPLMASFFRGRYAVDVVRQGGAGKRSYSVAAPPPRAVFDAFRACVDELTKH